MTSCAPPTHRTPSTLEQNVALYPGIRAVFVVLAFLGQSTTWMAVFADMGARLIVVADGPRSLRS